jgi:hypothetical protein
MTNTIYFPVARENWTADRGTLGAKSFEGSNTFVPSYVLDALKASSNLPTSMQIVRASGQFSEEDLMRWDCEGCAIVSAALKSAADSLTKARMDYFVQTGTDAYDCRPATYYIVSQLVKSALPHRFDLLVPAEIVRNSAGIIIGCKSLGI